MSERRRFSDETQRYLDNKAAAPSAEDRRGADELRRASDAMRARLSGPTAEFTDRVLARLPAEPRPRRSAMAWALEPRSVRVQPWVAALAAAAMLAIWIAGTWYGATRGAARTAIASAPGHDTLYVHFELAAPEARMVHLAGDFNGWRPDEIRMTRGAGGIWAVTVPIAVGVHSYQFVVNGSTWVADPAAGATDDGFGGRNSMVVVGPKGVVRS